MDELPVQCGDCKSIIPFSVRESGNCYFCKTLKERVSRLEGDNESSRV